MEYSTFEHSRPAERRVNCKKVAFWTSLSINVLIVLLIGYFALPQSASPAPRLSSYAVADADKDGKVTEEEIHEMIEEVMHDERAHDPSRMLMIIHGVLPHIIAKMDKNGDGQVDPREAAAIMGMIPQMIAGLVHQGGDAPHDNAEYMEVQGRIRNEFKDAMLDLALKNSRNESLSKEECFGNCFHRCRWMLEPETCVDTCNQGCGTDAEIFNPAAAIQAQQASTSLKFGESDANYTMALHKPGLKSDKVAVEVREQVLVVRGETVEQHKYYNLTHQFFHSVRLPTDAKKEEITSELEEETLTVTIPKDPELKEQMEAERKELEQIAAGKEHMKKVETATA